MNKHYTVSLIDDHPVLLDGLKNILRSQKHIQIIHTFSDGQAFLHAFAKKPTDLVIIDVHMKGKDGLECTQIIKSSHPATKVIIYSMFLEKSIIARAIKVGADAYLDKSIAESELLQKINDVLIGNHWKTPNTFETTENLLSKREKEIAMYIMEGMKAEEIAEKCFISLLTVRTHIRNIYTKLGVSGSHEMARLLSDRPEYLGI